LPVPLAVARFKFPYREAAKVAYHHRDDSSLAVLHAAKDAYDYLQTVISLYDELEKERNILAAENRMLKEM